MNNLEHKEDSDVIIIIDDQEEKKTPEVVPSDTKLKRRIQSEISPPLPQPARKYQKSHSYPLSASSDHETMICQYCRSVRIDEEIERWFGEGVCFDCKQERIPKFNQISTTNAKSQYLLSDKWISKLRRREEVNPINPSFQKMKLVLVKHCEV